jgi:glycerophosphoryl diester phosphodiesterase
MSRDGNDPVFNIPGPLLFAHRGGAKEVPEGTPLAFDHAKNVGADVLELDANLTADGKIVVWHGPSLKNVRLDHEDDILAKRTRKEIGEFTWKELHDQAWVDDYREEYIDVSNVPKDPERRILLLEDMLALYSTDPINIELKGPFGQQEITDLVSILDQSPSTGRRILIVSTSHGNLKQLGTKLAVLSPESGRRFALGSSAPQVFGAAIKTWLPFVSAGKAGRALQTTYWRPFCTKTLVKKVHKSGGAVHAFITPFWPIGGLDETKNGLKEKALLAVLDRGVDGIMTDRPSEVRPVIDQWKN